MSLINYLTLFILVCVSNTLCENPASVYEIIPRTDKQLNVLHKLDRKLKGISYWLDPSSVNKTVHLSIPGDEYEKFELLMKESNLTYSVKIPNVQKLLDNSIEPQLKLSVISTNGQSRFSWTRFHKLDEIYIWLDNLVTLYPKNATIVVAGHSSENREIKGIHLKFGEGKPGVFIEGGIHAREHLSHSTVTYLINALLTSSRADVRQIAQSYEWYIFPCVNPDGYVFTNIDPTSQNYRSWRKTRSIHKRQRCIGFHCRTVYCYGADPNRNWDFYWGVKGSDTTNPCSEIYAGKSAFSEIETKSLSRFISSVAKNLFAYISFHSYSQKLLFPYGYTRNHLDNYEEQYLVGVDAVNALSKRYGTHYEVGSISDIMGDVSGGSIDWVKGTHRVPFVYAYELRGQTSKGEQYGFVAPPSEIVSVGEETLDSLVALLQSAARRRIPK